MVVFNRKRFVCRAVAHKGDRPLCDGFLVRLPACIEGKVILYRRIEVIDSCACFIRIPAGEGIAFLSGGSGDSYSLTVRYHGLVVLGTTIHEGNRPGFFDFKGARCSAGIVNHTDYIDCSGADFCVVGIGHRVVNALAEGISIQRYHRIRGNGVSSIVPNSGFHRHSGRREIGCGFRHADAQLCAGHKAVGHVTGGAAGLHAVEAHVFRFHRLCKFRNLPGGVMRPSAFRHRLPIRSVHADFHAVFRHNAVGNGGSRLVAQGVQHGGFLQRQLDIALIRRIFQIFAPFCMPIGLLVVVHRKVDGSLVSARCRLEAGRAGGGLGIVVVPAAVLGAQHRLGIQVDGIAAAGAVIF